MNPYDQFLDLIHENGGLLDGDAIIDGKWHNIPAEEGRKGNKSFSYIAFHNEDGSIGGEIKNFYRHEGKGETFIFRDQEQQKTRQAQWAAQQRSREARAHRVAQQNKAREAEYERAAEKARYVYKVSEKADKFHPYLAKKGIEPHLAKVNNAGMLVIPMINEQGSIQSLEFIGDNGLKKILSSAKAAGAFTPIGFEKDKTPSQIVIAEGFATAASIYEATGIPSVHARGKGNIAEATEIMMRRYPDAEIIIAADNDQSKKKNYGLMSAIDIQKKHPGVIIMLPDIDGDYNDVHTRQGRQAIRDQFSDIKANQYINPQREKINDQPAVGQSSESALDHFHYLSTAQVEQLISKEDYSAIAKAMAADQISLTPSLARKLMEVPDQAFASKMMEEALQNPNPQVREAAAAILVQTNEGAAGVNYNDVSITATQAIEHDTSPISQFAAAQTDLDKQGIDLPDDIKNIITAWRSEIESRQDELGLSDNQVNKLSMMFEKRITANSDKQLLTPSQIKQKQLTLQKQLDQER